MNYITKHKNCKEGHAWNESKTIALRNKELLIKEFDNHDCHASPEDSCGGCEEFQKAVQEMSKTLEDKSPLITFNTNWNLNKSLQSKKKSLRCVECNGLDCYSDCPKYN